MKIMVNGAAAKVTASTLTGILAELGYADGRFATAVNEEFVPASARATRALAPGDRLEIVTPRQGG